MDQGSMTGGKTIKIGVDLGGTKILAAAINADHQILGRAKQPTPAAEGGPAILRTMEQCVRDALNEASVSLDDVSAIGVGSPGPLDSETGVIHRSANLNIRDFALGPELSQLLDGKPVLLNNDVTAGGYGEFKLGAGRGSRNLIAVFVGTGIGGCLVIDGHLFTGKTGNAGEVGHMVIKAGGPRCGCGSRGCLETYASRTAVTRRIGKALRNGRPSVLKPRKGKDKEGFRIKSRDLAAAIEAGDALAIREVNRAAKFLGLGVGGLINLLAPDRVVIGGGMTVALGEPYVSQVRSVAQLQAVCDPKNEVEIVIGELGDDAGVLGAALLACEKFGAA